MTEKRPRHSMLYYYLLVIGIMLVINLFISPWLLEREIINVDYNTFVEMVEDKKIEAVELDDQSNAILFKADDKIYETAMVNDPDLSQRLLDNDIKFNGTIIRETNPWVSLLLSWVIPIVIFVALGQYMSRKIQKGAKNAMTFGSGSLAGLENLNKKPQMLQLRDELLINTYI